MSLAIGLTLLVTRGVPRAQPPAADAAVCTAPDPESIATTVWIEQTDARAKLTDPGTLFVDCRSTAEFQAGHIANALSIPSDQPELPEAVERLLGSAQTIVAYCDAHSGCESSHRLAARLRELGYSDVRILRDGMPGWLERGYPAESGPCRVCEERL